MMFKRLLLRADSLSASPFYKIRKTRVLWDRVKEMAFFNKEPTFFASSQQLARVMQYFTHRKAVTMAPTKLGYLSRHIR
jgi:hypothetical protein